jgi:hypothetical protein
MEVLTPITNGSHSLSGKTMMSMMEPWVSMTTKSLCAIFDLKQLKMFLSQLDPQEVSLIRKNPVSEQDHLQIISLKNPYQSQI